MRNFVKFSTDPYFRHNEDILKETGSEKGEILEYDLSNADIFHIMDVYLPKVMKTIRNVHRLIFRLENHFFLFSEEGRKEFRWKLFDARETCAKYYGEMLIGKCVVSAEENFKIKKEKERVEAVEEKLESLFLMPKFYDKIHEYDRELNRLLELEDLLKKEYQIRVNNPKQKDAPNKTLMKEKNVKRQKND